MALDTDLCFIREDSSNHKLEESATRRYNHGWRRLDADINFPFSNLKQDVNRYPYATFEIKLNLGPNESEAAWVTDVEQSGLLEKAYQFSKFVHGMAIMFDTRVPLLPYWLAQIDYDDDRKLLPVLPAQQQSNTKQKQKQPQTEHTSLLSSTQPTTSYASITSHHQPESSTQASSITSSSRQSVSLPPGVKVPKKIKTSIKVEPKVFFANERTYFSWMRFSLVLATFSLALFNSGDAIGKLSGIIYTLISVSVMIYGAGLYYRRRELIRNRLSGPYIEIIAPTLICFALLFAVGINAYLKFSLPTPRSFYLF